MNNNSRYEKSNVIERCPRGRSSDVGFVFEYAGDDHDYNTSNHGHGSTATARTNNDYNDAHGQRLLIATSVPFAPVVGTVTVAVEAFQN